MTIMTPTVHVSTTAGHHMQSFETGRSMSRAVFRKFSKGVHGCGWGLCPLTRFSRYLDKGAFLSINPGWLTVDRSSCFKKYPVMG